MSLYWNDGTSLYHYGIQGQKWGQRRFQNEDGTLTEEGKRRYGRLDRYRNKLVGRTKRRANNAKINAKQSREHYENVKKYGKGSEEYSNYVKSKLADTSDWVSDENERNKNAYENLRTYNKYYSPIDWTGIQKQTIVDLMKKYEDDEREYKAISKSWMNANKALMDMPIDAVVTTKADIRLTMKNNR